MGVPAPLLAALQRKTITQPTLKQPNIMTKKHFIELADFIKTTEIYGVEPFTPKQIAHLGIFCRNQNCAFKLGRWLDYIAGECGPNGGAVKK